jgi:hypothetical protein
MNPTQIITYAAVTVQVVCLQINEENYTLGMLAAIQLRIFFVLST